MGSGIFPGSRLAAARFADSISPMAGRVPGNISPPPCLRSGRVPAYLCDPVRNAAPPPQARPTEMGSESSHDARDGAPSPARRDLTAVPNKSARARAWARTWAVIAAIGCLTAATTLHRLGDSPVCGANEAVEGVFLQQMVEGGALLFPLENSREPMYKPPLFHWTSMALDHLSGAATVTPLNLRLPSALYATAGAILTSAFAASVLGPRASWIAGLILASSYQYLSQGRIGRVDMTLTFFEALSLFSFVWWLGARNRSARLLHYLLALALGLAVLAKGPVGALLPLATITILLVWERRWREMRALCARGPLLVAFALAAWWYAACLIGQRYGFLSRQLSSENFGRFFGTLGRMSPWYYVGPILINSVPWSLLVPAAVFSAFRLRTPQRPEPGADRTSAVRLAAIFWIVTVVFFTVAAYKRRTYLLPLWPPSAFLLAWWLEPFLAERRDRRRWFLGVSGALIVFFFFYLPAREQRECAGNSFAPAAAAIAQLVRPDEPLYAYDYQGEMAPLLFYLRRSVPIFDGPLDRAPEGYFIVPGAAWPKHEPDAKDFDPILETGSGDTALVLLRRRPPQ